MATAAPDPIAAANDTQRSFPHACVLPLLERVVRSRPSDVAVIAGGTRTSYAELWSRSGSVACSLRRRGIGRGDLVGVLVGRTASLAAAILGVLRAGAAYVPLEPDHPAERLGRILDACSPRLVLCDGTAEHAWPSAELLAVDEAERRGEGPEPRVSDVRGDDLAYVMFTSGSTGAPKGVMLEHSSLANFIQWCALEYRRSRFDVILSGTSFGFDLSNVELYYSLASGTPLVLMPSSSALGLYVRRFPDALVNTVPSLVNALLAGGGSLEGVSVLNLGGEDVPPGLFRRIGDLVRSCEVRNMYGPTETTSTAVNHRFTGADDEVLIGRPIANVEVLIQDAEGRPAGPGQEGELLIAGAGVARGYLNDRRRTAERFVPHPCRTGAVAYRTGDMGLWTSRGAIRFLGRRDEQVKVHGHRIELGEVTAALLACEGVDDAAVLRDPGEEGEGRMVAFLRPASIPPDRLRRQLASKLPTYMLPEQYVFLDALPLGSNGKLDRGALAATARRSPAAERGEVPRSRALT